MQAEPLLSQIEPPATLLGEVLARVARARRARARARLAAFAAAGALSAAALADALAYAAREWYASGFGAYLALAFSDRALALAYSRDLLFSLVEALPSFAILLLIGFVALFAWSVKRASGEARAAFLPLPAHA
ncbi:MAG: hypothetical protein KGI78_02195 [Patescibacteria group bacterium]|nr:hypothetical protein [Patescibacteria group bacterium]